LTVTITDCPALPPAPLQTKTNVLVWVKGPTTSLPAGSLVPVQASKASQASASVDDQVRVEESFGLTESGLAASETVGGGGGGNSSTVTVTDWVVLVPAPLQTKINVLVSTSGPTTSVPDVPLVPDHAPDAVHELASVDDQVSVVVPLRLTLIGSAVRETVGDAGGATVTVTD
jgi:hypothetical protein